MAHKKVEWTPELVRSIETLYENGYTEEFIRKNIIDISNEGWKRLFWYGNDWVKQRFNSVKERVVAKATDNLKKLADGFTVLEKTFVVPFKVEGLKENKERLLAALQDERFEDFQIILLGLAKVDIKDADKIKVLEKEIPPDYRANQLLLQAHNPDVWDLEAKNKKIPQTKIVVQLEGKDVKQLRDKSIKADYIVEGK